ncbi:hypothetical protein NQ317_019867 [Molorchus minor]|uniref:Amidase domain-containing protein n=1 Tax=Molorchus minor TaxID=1323400 RepID=A0ABQ9ITU6_9CUCU|nr:hypothetical protein NQ317_019867 [Molorchus minor]
MKIPPGVKLAIGSDTGGSTRNPASYCGVIGLKPTYGLVSRWGLIPLVNSMDVPGILTRKVDDAVSILNAVAGFDPKDSTSLTKGYRPNKVDYPPANKLSIKDLKVGIPIEYHCTYLSKEVLDVWKDIAQLLEDGGAIIKQVSLPHTEYSIVCYSILNQCEVASNMARYDGIEYGFRANEHTSTEKLFATSRHLGFNEVIALHFNTNQTIQKKLPLSLQLIGRNLSEPMLLALAKYIGNAVNFPHFVNNGE